MIRSRKPVVVPIECRQLKIMAPQTESRRTATASVTSETEVLLFSRVSIDVGLNSIRVATYPDLNLCVYQQSRVVRSSIATANYRQALVLAHVTAMCIRNTTFCTHGLQCIDYSRNLHNTRYWGLTLH